jgi:hypothetical protein
MEISVEFETRSADIEDVKGEESGMDSYESWIEVIVFG